MHASIRNSIYLFLGLLGFKATPASAAQDIFLCAAELEGESLDVRYPGCMDVLAWSWGASNSGNTHTGGGAGVVSVQDLSVVKYIDKASPDIMLFTANGINFPKLELLLHTPCAECKIDEPYYSVTMENVIVSSFAVGGSAGEDRLTENVTFNFSKVEWCYSPQNPDGSQGPKECKNWDIQANAPF